MKKITEKELMESVRALRDYTDMLEGVQQEDAAQAGNIVGQAGRTAANVATAPVRGAYQLGQGALDAASNAWQGVKNFAGGVVQGATTGGLDPLNPTASAQQAQQSYAQAGQPSQSAAQSAAQSAWPSTPAAIKAFQQASGLTPDGLIGPKTMQALTNQGIKPPAGFQMVGTKKANHAPVPSPAISPADQTELANDWQQYQSDMAALKSPQQQSVASAAAPQQGMQQGMNSASQFITPNFASQSSSAQPNAYKESTDVEMSRFRDIFSEDTNLQEVKDTSHVTFQQENSLSRIVQLSHR